MDDQKKWMNGFVWCDPDEHTFFPNHPFRQICFVLSSFSSNQLISHGLNYFCSIQFQPPTSSNNLCLRFCLILILWLQAMYFLTCLLRSSISLLSDWTRSQELLVLAGSCRPIVNPPPYEDDDFKLYKPNQNLFFFTKISSSCGQCLCLIISCTTELKINKQICLLSFVLRFQSNFCTVRK